METEPQVVAVIDDDLGIRNAISRLLSALGYIPELYASADEFLVAGMTTEAICLIVDIQLGESSGLELVQHLAGAGSTTPIIFMTANPDESLKRRAAELGCVAWLSKPFAVELLRDALIRISPRL
jgi:FixJ family two-component response regulator